jgi:hypothetical protein
MYANPLLATGHDERHIWYKEDLYGMMDGGI